MSEWKPWIEAQKQSLKRAVSNVSAFLQTPFGATAGGGLVVVVAAKVLFG